MKKQKSKIIYLSINSSYSHSSLAYGQLRSISEKHAPEWTWDIIECSIKDNVNDILYQIQLMKPDLIVGTVYLFNRAYIFDITSRYSVISPKTTILLGGPEFLGNNEDVLKQHPHISAIIRGDESSLPSYLNLLASTELYLDKINEISGICFISKNNRYFDGGTALLHEDINSLPSPYIKGYVNKDKPFMQMETSRGCPSKCSFCTSSLTQRVQLYSLNTVRSNLQYIRNSGIKEVRVLDRTFNIPSTRAVDLLKLFSEEFYDIRFHMEFDPYRLTESISQQLSIATSGQFHIETGIQTFYPPALHAVNRKADVQKTEENLQKLVNIQGIEIHADLIYGLPKQTVESVFDDLRKLILIGPEEIQIEVLKILPGTIIRSKTSLKYSISAPYDVLSTERMTLNDILNFSYLSKIIDSYYNIKATRKLFQFAVFNNTTFLKDFLQFAAKRFSSYHGKPAPAVRFKLLFEFALETDNDLLYSITLFTYFCCGFYQNPKGVPSKKTNIQGQIEEKESKLNDIKQSPHSIELIKRTELREILKKNMPILWSDDKITIDKPAYMASFEYNATDIWLNPKASVKLGTYKYLFLLSQGGMNKKVSKILNII